MKIPLLLLMITFSSSGFLNAQIRNDSIEKLQKTLLIVTSRENLPRAQQQLDIVKHNQNQLKLADVNVYVVTPKRIISVFQNGQSIGFNPTSYKKWIDDQHNYMTLLIDESGNIDFKSPDPVEIRDIFAVFRQHERQKQVRENVRPDTVYER